MIDLNNYDKVIIYQFGKVGSMTLLKTFEKYIKTIHLHIFDKTILKDKTIIINISRNLFDRNISAFFHNINNKPKYIDIIKYKNTNIKKNEGHVFYYGNKDKSINNLINYFNDINTNIILPDYNKNWYTDFNNNLNINIFEKQFDFKKKYNLYNISSDIILITLRFEDINNWANILNNIFLQNIKLVNCNLTNKKKIYNLYIEFKKKYKYSESEINYIKNIDFMTYFYSNDEIDSFISKYI